ncbi:MAG: response regulator [Candidatus Cloacimonetes bacterium]|nr:response regulator [Candidatus Cloacimonadota bacterium]
MKKFLYNLNLTQKKLLFISIIILLMLISTRIFLPALYTKTLHSIHYQTGRELTRNFAAMMDEPLNNNNNLIIQSIVDTIQKFQIVLYVKIYDNRGNIFIPSDIEVDSEYNNFLVMREAIYHDFNFLGTLELGIDLKNVETQARIFTQKVIYIMIGISIFTLAILFLFLEIYVSIPLKKLIPNITKIIEGDLNHNIPVYANDEIGILSKKINTMVFQIKENFGLTSNILDSMSSVIITLDDKYNILNSNTHFNTFIKLNKSLEIEDEHKKEVNFTEISHQSIWAKMPFFVKYKSAMDEVLAKGKPLKLLREVFDKEKYYKIIMFPLQANDLTGIVIRIDDVTEEEQKDEQIKHGIKMEALSTLVGGLANDFNNILCGIVSTVSILKYNLQQRESITLEKIESLISDIDLSATRAEDMTKQFLSILNKTEINLEFIDLNKSIKKIEKICKNSFEKNITLVFKYFPENAFIKADNEQIEQVLLNLMVNSRHAMTIMKNDPESIGVLKVSLELVELDDITRDSHTDLSDDFYWKITISDTGAGIEKENLKKIWEPFFTTKDFNTGTGLGLAMVYKIISQHNGFIEVKSQVNVGSEFYIYLPKITPFQVEKTEIKEQKPLNGNGETILVVDDDALIRQIASSILSEANYKVLLAEDGPIAIDRYRENRDIISLVMLDLIMPEMNGKDTYIELKKINPSVKTILCSGFINDELITNMTSIGINHFIKKPFTINLYTKMVYDVLKEN